MLRNKLKREWKFYNKHKAELVSKYLGKEVLIYHDSVRGAFDNASDAINFATEHNFTPNRFMIQKITEKDEECLMSPVLSIVE